MYKSAWDRHFKRKKKNEEYPGIGPLPHRLKRKVIFRALTNLIFDFEKCSADCTDLDYILTSAYDI